MENLPNSAVDIIGVYAVPGESNVHLVELFIRHSPGIFDVGAFTQEMTDQPESDWQVAYHEHILDRTGNHTIYDGFSGRNDASFWTGDVRLTFFFHHLDFNKPLKTPFGDVTIPAEAPVPERLAFLEYEPPC